MRFTEAPLLFACGGDELVGILSVPDGPTNGTGVLIVVGGPQYRVGSHRQFVLLARHLARNGIACMRFDYRGMGDATGEQRTFEAVGDDIGTAVDRFIERVPALKRIVLWGLCDGASAACFYAPRDSRISGIILVNPWVRTEAGEARTLLKHHYLKRLIDRRFWQKLLSGDVQVRSAIRGVVDAAGGAVGRARPSGRRSDSLPDRMAESLAASGTPFALALSGRDYVAAEFEEMLSQGGEWASLSRGGQCLALERVPLADHTFSSAALRDVIAGMSTQWLPRFADRSIGDR